MYRNLLKQSARVSDQTKSGTLTGLIKKRFRLDRRVNSPRVICDALKQGREAFTTIRDATNGSSIAHAQLTTTLEQLTRYKQEQARLRSHQNSLRSPTRPAKLAKIAHLEKHRSKEWAEKIPNPIPIAERPVPQDRLPNPEKPRRVPILTSSQGFPFLRYKSGPQSPILSAVLKSRYQQEFRRWENVGKLQDNIEHGLAEDDWDRALHQCTGYHDDQDVGEGGVFPAYSWAHDTQAVLHELQDTLKRAAWRKSSRADEMWEIVQKEKKLAIQEKEERKAKLRKDSIIWDELGLPGNA